MAQRQNGLSLEWWRILCVAVLSSGGSAHGVPASDQGLGRAETRLRAIYEQGDFRAGRYRVEWLADSSAYVVEERPAGADRPQLTRA